MTMRTRPDRRCVLAAAAVVLGVATAVATLRPDGPPRPHGGDPEAAMASRAASVMPFDLAAATVHTFTPTTTGGVQQVLADDGAHTATAERIRRHLRSEAARFARGDFTDPAAIHGHDMAGLAELRAGAPQVAIRYADPARRRPHHLHRSRPEPPRRPAARVVHHAEPRPQPTRHGHGPLN